MNLFEQWHDFAVAAAGAAAALTGLLFVAISINLDDILRIRSLPLRAASALGLLTALLLAALFALSPGTGAVSAGVLTVGAGVIAGACRVYLRMPRTVGDPLWWSVKPLVVLGPPGLCLVIAGALAAASVGASPWWFLAAVSYGFAAAAEEAWVLLVEIKR